MRAFSLLLAAGAATAACTASLPLPDPSSATSPAYHAVGTEPFWSLTVDQQELTFTRPDALPLSQPGPKAIVGVAGEIYQTPRIRVNIVHAQCSDGMSDRIYPDKVQVDVDGEHFEGCGGLQPA